MSSRKQIEANRRNARKSTGPKTSAGSARSSKNSFRHGLNAAADDKDSNEKIAKLSDMLCDQNASEAEHYQATIVAECQVLIGRVRASRVIAIETMRKSAVPPFVPSYIIQEKTDEMMEQFERGNIKSAMSRIKSMVGKVVRSEREYMKEQFRCWRSLGGSHSQDGVVTHKNGERLPRTDCESLMLALEQLRALDRYEKRALSRRRNAIERLAALRATWRAH